MGHSIDAGRHQQWPNQCFLARGLLCTFGATKETVTGEAGGTQQALERGCQAAGRRSPYMVLAGKIAAKRLGWRAYLGTGTVSGTYDPWRCIFNISSVSVALNFLRILVRIIDT